MSRFTPAIYEAASRPIQLDLGSTAVTVDDINGRVAQLALDLAPLPPAMGKANLKLDVLQASTRQVQEGVTAARVDLNNFAGATSARLNTLEQTITSSILAARDHIVKHIDAARPPVGALLNKDSAPLVRKLTQAQAIALDGTPHERHDKGPHKDELKNDVALKQLLDSTTDIEKEALRAAGLWQGFEEAFGPFRSNELPERARRYAEADRLIHAIVDHFKS